MAPGDPSRYTQIVRRAPFRWSPLALFWLAPAAFAEPVETATTAGPLEAQNERPRPRLDGPPPPNRLFLHSITAVRINPLGLLELATLSYRSRIFESESLALMDNFAGLGVTADLSPAFARIGPLIELQPLTMLRL
jgi:hypothetical protein